jgi:hypothetical protein
MANDDRPAPVALAQDEEIIIPFCRVAHGHARSDWALAKRAGQGVRQAGCGTSLEFRHFRHATRAPDTWRAPQPTPPMDAADRRRRPVAFVVGRASASRSAPTSATRALTIGTNLSNIDWPLAAAAHWRSPTTIVTCLPDVLRAHCVPRPTAWRAPEVCRARLIPLRYRPSVCSSVCGGELAP